MIENFYLIAITYKGVKSFYKVYALYKRRLLIPWFKLYLLNYRDGT